MCVCVCSLLFLWQNKIIDVFRRRSSREVNKDAVMFREGSARIVGTPASVLTASCLNSSPSGPPCATTITLYSAEEKTALPEFTCSPMRG